MDLTKIEVLERNDPTITLWVVQRNLAGVETPYDFTGGDLEFWQKIDFSLPDGTTATYASNGATPKITLQVAPPWDSSGNPIIGNTTRNVFQVEMSSANLSASGVKFYRVDFIKASKRITVMRGQLIINPT